MIDIHYSLKEPMPEWLHLGHTTPDMYCRAGHLLRFDLEGDVYPLLPCATCTRLHSPLTDEYTLPVGRQVRHWKLKEVRITRTVKDAATVVIFPQWVRTQPQSDT